MDQTLIYRHVIRSGSVRPHLFLSGYSCIVDLDLFRHLYETSEEYKQLLIDLEIIEPSHLVDHFAKMLSDFEGLALCVPEDVVEAKWDDFWRDRGALELASWNTRLEDDFRQNPSRRKGRPKLSLAYEAFSKMNFQKGELSWEALARKIQIQSGEKPSHRTLRGWANQNKT